MQPDSRRLMSASQPPFCSACPFIIVTGAGQAVEAQREHGLVVDLGKSANLAQHQAADEPREDGNGDDQADAEADTEEAKQGQAETTKATQSQLSVSGR
jgi:hypothetical protein